MVNFDGRTLNRKCTEHQYPNFGLPTNMRTGVLWMRTRGKMADAEMGSEVAETSAHNLTITEDQNASISTEDTLEKEAIEEPYSYGFSLPGYYEMCLQYYHKGIYIIIRTEHSVILSVSAYIFISSVCVSSLREVTVQSSRLICPYF